MQDRRGRDKGIREHREKLIDELKRGRDTDDAGAYPPIREEMELATHGALPFTSVLVPCAI